uniref:Uncharacterized protein n=1 Tax=Oryza sativa subsp. japonica TaxID=39947 RepID=Q8H2K8_ORYSJ|nr:hypothetical protein [Oryza sativa Japonica Group]
MDERRPCNETHGQPAAATKKLVAVRLRYGVVTRMSSVTELARKDQQQRRKSSRTMVYQCGQENREHEKWNTITGHMYLHRKWKDNNSN